MKNTWRQGDPEPEGSFHRVELVVEQCPGGFWCHSVGRRSPGRLPDTPLHETLIWILEQINFGHLELVLDEDGKVLSMIIGRDAPREASSPDEAAEQAEIEHKALNVAGLLADSREKGCHPNTAALEKLGWDTATSSAQRRIEIHYAIALSELLGRISKKLRKLELLPILESAPETTRSYLAEATRCYLLKMDRACISLCRACLEDTLQGILSEQMNGEWVREMKANKQKFQNPQPMRALIDVCARHGMLGKYATDAHKVREAGNRILHPKKDPNVSSKFSAGDVLKMTRKIIGAIYGSTSFKEHH